MDEVKGRIVMLDNLATAKIKMEPVLARLEFSALLLRKSLEQFFQSVIGSLPVAEALVIAVPYGAANPDRIAHLE
jgi:hypothetical protein